MSDRCPACGTDREWEPTHDVVNCVGLKDDITFAVKEAGRLGLPTDSAARLVGAIGCEIPPPARLPAVLGALAEWLASKPYTGDYTEGTQ